MKQETKNFVFSLLFVVAFFIATTAAAVLLSKKANGGISGSPHDFSGKNWNPNGQLCVVCHTPHNSANVAGAPLWNHETTQSVFNVYGSATLDAAVGQPTGISKLCLSCHDGTVAIDNFGGTTAGTDIMQGSTNLTSDLSNDHPISFVYDSQLALADTDLHDPSTTQSGLGGTISTDLLPGGTLECSSCHDVHNGSAIPKLLVKSNFSSQLCLTCHNK